MSTDIGSYTRIRLTKLRSSLPANRWTYTTVLVGFLFAVVQVSHTVGMLSYGPVGAVLEGVIPLLFAVGVIFTGPWLHLAGYTRAEQKRIVGWMALVGAVSGLLFLWALSHQLVVAEDYFAASSGGSGSPYSGSGGGYGSTTRGETNGSGLFRYASGGVFPHAKFVTATNLTAGALLGLVLGVYNVRSRRHYRTAQRQKDRVAQQRTRLSVLNRVLRHNLRNEANVILGSVRTVIDRTDGEPASHAERAATAAERLVTLGDKARDIDQTIGDDLIRTDDIALRALVNDVVEAVSTSETPVEISMDVPDSLRMTTNKAVLSRVIEEVIENAVEHSEASPIRIDIGGRINADGWVELVIADNGPGIPDHEAGAFEATEETALEHGSGLGLWLARWGTTTLGGDIAYRESETGGTAVILQLPQAAAKPGVASTGDKHPVGHSSAQNASERLAEAS